MFSFGCSYADVARAKLVTPTNAGKDWVGIRHKDMVKHFSQAVYNTWGVSEDTRYAMSNYETDLAIAHVLKSKSSIKHSIGLRTSNARKYGIMLYVGIVRMYEGEEIGIPLFKYPIIKRHREGIDLDGALLDGMLWTQSRIEDINSVIKEMEAQELSSEERDHLVLKAGREKILPWHLIGQFDQDLGMPSANTWVVLKRFAKIVRRWNVPKDQMVRVMKFGAMLPGYPVSSADTVIR